MKTLWVEVENSRYSIEIECGLLNLIPDRLRQYGMSDEWVIVTDENVKRLYGLDLLNRLQSKGFRARLFEVPAGEDSKSLAQTERLYTQLIENRTTRQAVVVALGGGV
ncbi:3-dehydroquinate synthase, partial [candidate division KSB1 bacterium]|nr:3-dehydroquinate synthase [candidate division KSB1 bacterium]